MLLRRLPTIVWMILGLLILLLDPFGARAADVEMQFDLIMGGASLGSETVTVGEGESDGTVKLTTDSKLSLGGSDSRLSTELVWDAGTGEASSYQLRAFAGGVEQQVKMVRGDGKADFIALVGGTEVSQEGTFDKPLLVLDNMVAGHYVQFLDWLQATDGKVSEVSVAVPQPMKVLSGSIEVLPDELGEFDGKPVQVRVHSLQIFNVVVQIRHAESVPGRLLQVDVPIQKFTLTRDGYAKAAAPRPKANRKLGVRELEFQGGSLTIGATMTYPREPGGKVPGVVLVHGSGPNDRDETIAMNKPFRDLAEGLTEKGIAVLRYDKRTYSMRLAMQKGASWEDNVEHLADMDDVVVDDAVTALKLLQEQPEVDPNSVYVVGHSLGGMAMPYILQKAPWVAGGVSLAGASRALDRLMKEQTRYLSELAGIPEEEIKLSLDTLDKEFEKIRDEDTDPNSLVLGGVVSFWRDLFSRQPAPLAASLDQPMLFLRGAKDYQVTAADQAVWMEAVAQGRKGNASFKTWPDLNHLFMPVKGTSDGAEYQKAGHVAPEVVAEIAGWIRDTRSAAQ